MPKVEQYGGPQASTQMIQGPRAQSLPLAAFPGAQFAEGIAEVGKGLQDYQMKIDKTSAEEALVNFERDKNKLFFDPKSGYFNLQGKDAYDNASDVSTRLEKLKETYSTGLSSEQARQMFDRVATNHVLSAQQDVMQHASKGFQAWELSTAKAVVENTIENASLYWNDPKKLSIQKELGRQQVLDVAKREGIGSEATNERLQTFNSSFAEAAIDAALVKGSTEARDLMKKYDADLEGPMKAKLEKSILTREKAERTQAISQQSVIMANKAIDIYGDDRASVLEEIKKIKDPELQQAARREANNQLNQLDKVKTQQRMDAYQQADDYVRGGGTVDGFVSQYPDQWELMTPTQRRSLEKGAATENDWNLWYKISVDMNDKELVKLNSDQVADMTARLDKSHRDKLITMIRSARGETGDKGKVDNQVGRTRATQVKSSIEQLIGKNTGKFSPADKARSDQFYQLFDTELASREAQKGAPLDSNEFTMMLNDFTRKVTIQKSLFGIGYDVERQLSDIPQEDLSILTNYLRANNIEVTTENLVRAYEQANQ